MNGKQADTLLEWSGLYLLLNEVDMHLCDHASSQEVLSTCQSN